MTTYATTYLDGLKYVTHEWAKNEVYKWREPTLQGFLNIYPEYDHEELYELMESEIKSVAEI